MLKKVKIKKLIEGMVIGEDVLGREALPVVGRGKVIDERILEYFKENYKPDDDIIIYFKDSISVNVDNLDDIDNYAEEILGTKKITEIKPVKFEGSVEQIPIENIQDIVKNVFANKQDFQTTKKMVEMLKENVSESFDFLIAHNEINDKKFLQEASKVVKTIDAEEKLVNPGYLYLIELEKWHPDTYNHSIDVAFFTLLLASQFTNDVGELTSLFLGGLLHDIGKYVQYQEGDERFYQLITKMGPLTDGEFDVLKKHVDVAHFFDDKFKTISKKERENIMFGALDHHEKLDGSGYLRNKKGHQISLAGRMIAVVDIYDAMTRKREYKSMVKPYIAMRHILSLSQQGKVDKKLTNMFKKLLGVYPTGSVLTTNKGLGIVGGQTEDPYRPKLMFIENPAMGEVDLVKHQDIDIYEELE